MDEWAGSHEGDIFAAASGVSRWQRRLAHLVPHLLNGPDHERAVGENLASAIRFARRGDAAEAERQLQSAEAASPGLVLAPPREAQLIEKIKEMVPGYARITGEPGRYVAEVMEATRPEWTWIYDYITAHPEVLAPQPGTARQDTAATADTGQDAADRRAQAKIAMDAGRYGEALALIDDAEILDPLGARYEQIRTIIRDTAAAAAAQPPAPEAAEAPTTGIPGQAGADTAATSTPAGASAGQHGVAPDAALADVQTGPAPGDQAPEPTAGSTAEAAGPAGSAPDGEPGAAADHETGSPDASEEGGPPAGTRELAELRGWRGPRRPERLIYPDGTLLTARSQGEDGDQDLPCTAAGIVTADGDHAPGDLQVVRFDDGSYAAVHPALLGPRGADPYPGLTGTERQRWQLFDYHEAGNGAVAYLPATLITAGDTLQVERGPQSRTMDLREVTATGPHDQPGIWAVTIRTGARSTRTLTYPQASTAGVRIPAGHPTLAAAIRAATAGHPSLAAGPHAGPADGTQAVTPAENAGPDGSTPDGTQPGPAPADEAERPAAASSGTTVPAAGWTGSRPAAKCAPGPAAATARRPSRSSAAPTASPQTSRRTTSARPPPASGAPSARTASPKSSASAPPPDQGAMTPPRHLRQPAPQTPPRSSMPRWPWAADETRPGSPSTMTP